MKEMLRKRLAVNEAVVYAYNVSSSSRVYKEGQALEDIAYLIFNPQSIQNNRA
jgi:hypothetical protein